MNPEGIEVLVDVVVFVEVLLAVVVRVGIIGSINNSRVPIPTAKKPSRIRIISYLQVKTI